MSATTKLIVYNDALRELGSHPLANLTSTNTRLTELEGAFPHAVEYVLSKVDWNFARRRETLGGVADTSYTPYTYRYARPTDYLRKVWFKTTASDTFQIDHAESGAVIYAFESTGLLEYISDHADNYDPANWGPMFTRAMVLYLALLTGPKIATLGADQSADLYGQLDLVISEATDYEAVFVANAQISPDRDEVMRRAIEMLGQQIGGSVAIYAQTDKMRWHMNQAWDGAVKYVLEQGAWNHASRRMVFDSGLDADTVVEGAGSGGIIEGYSTGTPVAETAPAISGYLYAYSLPDDFLHKIWIKQAAISAFEIDHQRIGSYIFTNQDCVMEYVSSDDNAVNPLLWPQTFSHAVSAYLALTVSAMLVLEQNGDRVKVSASGLRNQLDAMWRDKLSDAKRKDAIQQLPKELPPGKWARSRAGSNYRG
jgi:hypothetical protein